jgi:23S rRNA-/tRNA-specific pseudouridylate synthase
MIDENLDIENGLIPSVLDAVGDTDKNKGAVASIMNALIGACCYHATNNTLHADDDEDDELKALLSDRMDSLLLSYGNLDESKGISPDIVSYSLAYTALRTDPNKKSLADTILNMAIKRAKKIAGGKRRKILASSRRKAVSSFTESEPELKELLGSDFEVLMETDDFAVINKPSGVPCFHLKTTTAGKIKKKKKKGKDKDDTHPPSKPSDISLEDALVDCNVPLSTLNPDAVGLVHRIDRGSSGCMVIAKSDEMHARLLSEFFLRRTTKKYLTLVQQSSTSSIAEDEGWIDQPVDNRPAKSKYRVIERYPSENNIALLEFEIFTGRKHQIRVHASEALSSPVLNDVLYSKGRDEDKVSSSKNSDQFFLHASNLSIPRLGIDVVSPIPSWWNITIAELQQK